MSTEDAEEIEDEPEPELQDPDDYHRRQRLKEIHKARNHVHDVMHDTDTPGRQHRKELAHAVSMYVAELEPLIQKTEADVSLPENYPWDTALQFADALGRVPSDADVPHASHETHPPRPNSIVIYRLCNRILADVKPLIEEDDSDEWEV